MANIIIYGGGFQAAAAASKAASQAGNAQIYVIIPYPVSDTSKAFGSIGTLGGQNYFDVRSWNGAFPYKKEGRRKWVNGNLWHNLFCAQLQCLLQQIQ